MKKIYELLYRIGYLKKPIYTAEHEKLLGKSALSDNGMRLLRSVFDDRKLVENYNQGRMRDLLILLSTTLVILLLAVSLYLELRQSENSSQLPKNDMYGNR